LKFVNEDAFYVKTVTITVRKGPKMSLFGKSCLKENFIKHHDLSIQINSTSRIPIMIRISPTVTHVFPMSTCRISS